MAVAAATIMFIKIEEDEHILRIQMALEIKGFCIQGA
jgi:hypothetical protein